MGTTNRAGIAGADGGAGTQDALLLLALLELLGGDQTEADEPREGDLFSGAPRNARLEVVR